MKEPFKGEPPSQKHSPTSREAAEAVKPKRLTLRAQVYRYLVDCGARGATDEEMQDALSMGANTQRPRRRELQLTKQIDDSGLTRATKSGRQAVVWIHEEPAESTVIESCNQVVKPPSQLHLL